MSFRTIRSLVLLSATPLLAARCSEASLAVSGTDQQIFGSSYASFGVVPIGASVSRTLTFTNSGGTEAILAEVGDAAFHLSPPFSVTGGTCRTGGAVTGNGGNCTLQITYSPKQVGQAGNAFQLKYNYRGSDSVDGFTLSLSVYGTAAEPGTNLVFSGGSAFDFNDKAVTSPVTKRFTLYNTGVAAAQLIEANAGFGLNQPFSVISTTCTPGAVLAAPQLQSPPSYLSSYRLPLEAGNGGCELVVQFAPKEFGPATSTASLWFTTSPYGTRQHVDFSLRGNGVAFVPAIAVSAGQSHTCALLANHRVRCWGQALYGQLGYGNTHGSDTPPSISGDVDVGGDVVQVAANGTRTCAILSTGALRCWGEGLLGYDDNRIIGDDETPASAGDIVMGDDTLQIALGPAHTCAVLRSGKLRCWGDNNYGQLGYGDYYQRATPATAGDVNQYPWQIQQIAAGGYHTCVLTNGAVSCWGSTSSYGSSSSPAAVSLGGSATRISAGGGRSCALLDTANVRCWGTGYLGYATGTTPYDDVRDPSAAGDLKIGASVAQISVGGQHTCVVLSSGKVRCWGLAGHGQLGYGNTNTIGDDETPASAGDVDVGETVTQISAGAAHTCALLASGNIRCWGQGSDGRLGYGNQSDIGDDETPVSAGNVPVQ